MTNKTKRLRRRAFAGGTAAAVILGTAVLSAQNASSADTWDASIAPKPAVLAESAVDNGPPRIGWEDGPGPRPVVKESHLIFSDATRYVWLTPSTTGGVCMIMDVDHFGREQTASCFDAETLARNEPFIFSTPYSLTIGVITADGQADTVARTRGGTVAAPNLVWLKTEQTTTPMAQPDLFKLHAEYS